MKILARRSIDGLFIPFIKIFQTSQKFFQLALVNCFHEGKVLLVLLKHAPRLNSLKDLQSLFLSSLP